MAESKVVLAFVIILVIVMAGSGQSQSSSGKKGCEDVKCKDPPSNLRCSEISTASASVASIASIASIAAATNPKPEGKHAECCPLWQCTEKDKKSDHNEIYTFHGLFGQSGGGTEVRKYTSTTRSSNNGKTVYNVVESIATGDHSSAAVASDSGGESMQDMQAMFRAFGM